MSSNVEKVMDIIQKMQNRIDELELKISNIYKYSDGNHIHTCPNNRLQREKNREKLWNESLGVHFVD